MVAYFSALLTSWVASRLRPPRRDWEGGTRAWQQRYDGEGPQVGKLRPVTCFPFLHEAVLGCGGSGAVRICHHVLPVREDLSLSALSGDCFTGEEDETQDVTRLVIG